MTNSLRDQLQTSLATMYVLERELAGGGMSRVFVADETALSRKVVVKVLPPEMAEGVSVDRFKREIALAARLQHPHIVPLLAAGDAQGLPWFSMPFVDGDSLRQRLSRGGELPVSEALRVLREVASALAYAHKQGVVHRDIKPENVLLSEGTAMVTDFGVAKAIADAGDARRADTLTSAGVALGTPAYMAPEQVAADPRMDHRADIYALGVLAYELLAGRTPFAGRSAQATLAAQVTESPESLSRLRPATPPALAQLVMRCLAKQAADRPQTAHDVMHLLDAITTPAAGTVSPAVESGSRVAVARNMRAAVAIGVLALATVVSVFIWRRSGVPSVVSRRVAVVPFTNLTGDPSLDLVGRLSADWLVHSIGQVDSVDVVSSEAVNAALGDTSVRVGKGMFDRLVRATRAALVVTGTMYREGDSLGIQAQLVDAKDGRVKMSLDAVHASRSEPLVAVDLLRDQLIGSLVTEGSRSVANSERAPKYSAWQEFLAGLELFQRRGDMFGSYRLFQRASQLDSGFLSPRFMLATALMNRQQWDEAEAIVRGIETNPRLGAGDRLLLKLSRANLSGDIGERLSAAQSLAARDPLWVWFYLVGERANSRLNPRVALLALERSDSASRAAGFPYQTMTMSEALHQAGLFARELAYVKASRAHFPSVTDLYSYQLGAFAALNRRTEAIALADTVLRGIADSIGTTAETVTMGAMEFRAHGDSATGRQLATMVQLWYAAHPLAKPPAARAIDQGTAYLVAGRLDSAELWFRRATADTTRVDAAGYVAVVRALLGDSVRAKKMADSIGGLERKWMFGANTFWRGAVLGNLATEKEKAVQVLKESMGAGQSMRLWHVMPALDRLRGYPSFDALVTPKR